MGFRSFILPFFATFTLHIAVVAMFFVDWKSHSPKIKIKPPQSIQAKLVEFKPKAKPAPVKKQRKKVDLTKKQKALDAQKKARAKAAEKKLALKKKREKEAKRKAKEKADAKKKAEQKKKALAEKRRKREQERKLQQEAEFKKALEEEQQLLLEESYNEQAQSYAALIRNTVEQKWSRPPSARNGMRCLLAISLVPSGRIVDVNVVQSSGDAAFDRSAVKAVQKVDTFSEIKSMPIGLFEREFRQFKLLFQPEDLRQ